MPVNEFLPAVAAAAAGVSLFLLLWSVWLWVGVQRRARRVARRVDALADDRQQVPKQPLLDAAIDDAAPRENRWLAAVLRVLRGSSINYAGQRFSTPQLIALSGLMAAGAFVALLAVFGFGLPTSMITGLVAWLVIFRLLVGAERRRSERLLVALFPEAIDMIVRMVRAGMAVNSAIRSASADLAAPLGPLFRAIAEEFAIGVPLDQVMGAVAERVRLAEFRFFAVAISLQHATGGNLTTTLENMADMMRRRRAMQLKAKAVVSEVRITATILSLLPVVVLLLLLFTSPTYVSALFTDHRGKLLLCAAVLCVLTGAGAMRWLMYRNLRL